MAANARANKNDPTGEMEKVDKRALRAEWKKRVRAACELHLGRPLNRDEEARLDELCAENVSEDEAVETICNMSMSLKP